jgi:polysaccharide pyruvyl transferase WcaK-like protein
VLASPLNAHPEAVVDAMAGGFERVRSRHGIPARPITWYERFEGRVPGRAALPLRVLGKLADPFRLLAWVRQHDAVIVPGAGILETTLPVRAYGFPLSTFMLTASGRLLGVKVALVSVGADVIGKRVTRALSNGTARMAFYRSYRDPYSAEVMRKRGIDTAADRVFPDLVFGIPTPAQEPGDPQLVGVGVMDYHGGNDDRELAAEIHAAYVGKMTAFVRWLLDNGYRVRLFGGDSKADAEVAERILASIEAGSIEAGSSAVDGTAVDGTAVDKDESGSPRLSVASMSSYAELLAEMNEAGTVVATRYHNVMCALKLSKPTISVGYSRKFTALMDGMGVGEYAQLAGDLNVDVLVKQFLAVQDRREELTAELLRRNAANAEGLAEQFALLTERLFS